MALNLWTDRFKMFELTEIMRQKDDTEFTELLNRLRYNSLTESDKDKVKACESFGHLRQRLRVSYGHQPMSVVRRPSSTLASNDISSKIARPRALIFNM